MCKGCEGRCCRYVAVQIDTPHTSRDFDNLRWMLMHDNTEIFIDHEKDWILQINVPCSKLDPKTHRCRIYKTRPLICKKLELEECEREGHEGEVHFYTPADLKRWRVRHRKR